MYTRAAKSPGHYKIFMCDQADGDVPGFATGPSSAPTESGRARAAAVLAVAALTLVNVLAIAPGT